MLAPMEGEETYSPAEASRGGMDACAFCYLEDTTGATMKGDAFVAPSTSAHLYPPPQDVVSTRMLRARFRDSTPAR
jgi:hypothetical protein